MTSDISSLRMFRVTTQPDGSIALLLEQKYSATLYVLDIRQAQALGKALIEIGIT